ncbi:MAG: GNAT family N-acetyltransferase, partial [Lactobacillus acidophilus]
GKIEFIYIDPNEQNKGIATKLMEKVITELQRPIRLEVFTNNEQAKALYEKFGFQTIETIIENWSDEYPVKFSQDTMELR